MRQRWHLQSAELSMKGVGLKNGVRREERSEVETSNSLQAREGHGRTVPGLARVLRLIQLVCRPSSRSGPAWVIRAFQLVCGGRVVRQVRPQPGRAGPRSR